jgi:hypothetical protein
MKPSHWRGFAFALAAFPVLACAQGMPMPNKLKNASPEMRAAYGYPEAPPEGSRQMPDQGNQQYDAGLACQMAKVALRLSELEHRYADVIQLLESPRAREGNCTGLETNRILLAQAYLMEAAKISARPSPANQKLVDRANAILNGDYTGLAAHAMSRPQAGTLAPFLAGNVHPDEVNSRDATTLCEAISQLNVEAARVQLEAGADPNGRCRHESLVGSLVFMATTEKDDRRREIMRALLEHGAAVTNIEACRSPTMGDCREVLLPLMEKYSRAAR